MKKQGKITTIINAFNGEIPRGQAWFEERISICNECEYNSKNNPPEGFINTVRKVLDGGKPHCLACSCYIEEKASMKEETCGLITIDKEPKWRALMVRTASKEDFDIYNNSPDIANLDLSADGLSFQLDYGNVSDKSNMKVQLLLEGKYEVSHIQVSCNCTTPELVKLNDGQFLLTIGVKPSRLKAGKFNKSVVVQYVDNESSFLIKLVGTKK